MMTHVRHLLIFFLVGVFVILIWAYQTRPGGTPTLTLTLSSPSPVTTAAASPDQAPRLASPSPPPSPTAPRWSTQDCAVSESWLGQEVTWDHDNRPPTLTASDRAQLDQWAATWAQMAEMLELTVCVGYEPAPTPTAISPVLHYEDRLTDLGCSWARSNIDAAIQTHRFWLGRSPMWPGDTQARQDQWNRMSIAGYQALEARFKIGCP